jgi:deoxyribodipyrimidine photo-lyase
VEKQYKKSLFIFRRDLRLQDNSALIAALQQSKTVIPCFIFNPKQVEKNPYRSLNAIQFMLETLSELASDLHKRNARMYFFYGDPCNVVEKLIKQESLDAIFNRLMLSLLTVTIHLLAEREMRSLRSWQRKMILILIATSISC